jgi:hypothetical protein
MSILLTTCLLLQVTPELPAGAEAIAAEALAVLAKRQTDFDRAILCVHFHKRELAPWRYDPQVKQPWPRFLDTKWRRTFVLKGQEISCITETLDSDDPLRVQKRSWKGGQFRHLGYMSAARPEQPALPSFEERNDNPEYKGAGLWREFRNIANVLGMGYDVEFATIGSAKKTEAGYVLEGLQREKFHPNPHGPTEMRLSIDWDGLVRRLELRIPNPGCTSLWETTTEGSVDVAGERLAKAGVKRCVRLTPAKGGGEPTRFEEYHLRVEFLSLRREFSDEEYKKLTEFDTPNHTNIWDHGKGVELYRDQKGQEKVVRPLPRSGQDPQKQTMNWVWWIVLIHGLLFLLAAGYWGWRVRRAKAA